MLAITNTGPSSLEMREWPLPEPGMGQVRVRTRACGVCDSDLKMIAGWPRTSYPAIPGHEWSGVVDALGPGVDETWLGAPVVAENVMFDGGEIGFEYAGGFGQYLVTEARCLYRLPEGFPFHLAALIEPLAVCVRAVRRLHAPPGQPVLVFGDGSMGLLSLLLLRHNGAGEVSVVGGVPERLEMARELGAAETFDYHDARDELSMEVSAAFDGPFPHVLEASGSPLAADTALRLAGRGGRVLILGDYDDAMLDMPWNFILSQELEIIGSNASDGAWPEAVRLAVEGALPLERLVTHRLPAEEYEQAIDLTRSRRDGAVKVVLEWD